MFAYNEEKNITKSVSSVFESVDGALEKLFVIANGCTDGTIDVLKALQPNFNKLEIVELKVGDKCNAWNEYVHNIAPNCPVHFFIDADVQFSKNCFPQMAEHLNNTSCETVAIAGMPLSGRNIEFYRSLVKERSCFFGNLYGLKYSFLETMRRANFKLPQGLNWIDSFLTKAVNTNLNFFNYNLPNRVTHLDKVGYCFDSLSLFKKDDIKLYFNRIARYELGKIQEKHLDSLDVKDWPDSMNNINDKIYNNLTQEITHLSFFKKYLVTKRIERLIDKA